MSPHLDSAALPVTEVPRRVAGASWWRRPVLRALEALREGRLELVLPDGALRVFGSPSPAHAASVRLRVVDEAFFARCVLYGDIGFAEAYLDGLWESDDPTAVVAWFIRNLAETPGLSGSRRRPVALNLLRGLNRAGHLLRRNSRVGARRNIEAHYDLSNEFFGLFLDSSMMYSAARWKDASSLEEAQWAKNEALCRKLRLEPSDHVLEIGSGWGGWAIQAARTYGCQVTSLTLSPKQRELARRRVAEAGLADRVSIELCDYRDVRGTFDKIVSIEMMEAIGHRLLPDFCRALHRLLRPQGVMALQFITCPDARYEEMRRGVDFIQKHIFPGSLLLSLQRVSEQMGRAGGFVLRDLEDLGDDYARTLACWRRRFEGRLPAVRALGFDERFIRKWTYYFCYCEAAFAMRNISVVQAVYERPNHPSA